MDKTMLAEQLRECQRQIGQAPRQVIDALSDDDIIQCYVICNECKESLVSQEEFVAAIDQARDHQDFLASVADFARRHTASGLGGTATKSVVSLADKHFRSTTDPKYARRARNAKWQPEHGVVYPANIYLESTGRLLVKMYRNDQDAVRALLNTVAAEQSPGGTSLPRFHATTVAKLIDAQTIVVQFQDNKWHRMPYFSCQHDVDE